MSNFLRPHGLQHTRPPCPSPSPSFPKFMSYRWCHPTISFFVVPFSSLPLMFPSIRVFSNELTLPISGQSIGASASASASVLPVTIPGWFPLGLTGLISFWLKNLLQNHNSKPSSLWHLAFLWYNSHILTWLLEKPLLWLYGPYLILNWKGCVQTFAMWIKTRKKILAQLSSHRDSVLLSFYLLSFYILSSTE